VSAPTSKGWRWVRPDREYCDHLDDRAYARCYERLEDKEGNVVLEYFGCGSHQVEVSPENARLIAAALELLEARRRVET
jgi:hypothetical protein